MQSAARVPIMISFEVEDYPGPDNDPILSHGFTSGSTVTEEQIDSKSLNPTLQRSNTEPAGRLKSAGRAKSNLSANALINSNNARRGGKYTSRRNLLKSAAEMSDNEEDEA
jgi:hypothetical protein